MLDPEKSPFLFVTSRPTTEVEWATIHYCQSEEDNYLRVRQEHLAMLVQVLTDMLLPETESSELPVYPISLDDGSSNSPSLHSLLAHLSEADTKIPENENPETP